MEISKLLIPGPRIEFRDRSPNVNRGIPGWSAGLRQFGSENGHGAQTKFVGLILKSLVLSTESFVAALLHWLGNEFEVFRGLTRGTGPMTFTRLRSGLWFCSLALLLE